MGAIKQVIGFKNYFSLLEDQFGGIFKSERNEAIMHLNNSQVLGNIKAIEVNKNEFLFEFDIKVKDNFFISIPPDGYNAINFLYCQKGAVLQSFGDSNVTHPLNEFQTAILAHESQKTVLHFTANSRVRLVLISVCNQTDVQPTPMIAKIHELFTNKMKQGKLAYFSSINVKISEQINALHDIEGVGIVRKLLIQGTVQLILGMEIQHHKQDLENKTLYAGSLTRRELAIVQELGEEIRKNVAEPYSIDMLMDKTGVSAAKLQEGFKLLYNRTVTDYIKNLRLEEAERLVKNTDLNVSQIVYTIGFSSRSYFSKIFRKKYGCSPNAYVSKSRKAATL